MSATHTVFGLAAVNLVQMIGRRHFVASGTVVTRKALAPPADDLLGLLARLRPSANRSTRSACCRRLFFEK